MSQLMYLKPKKKTQLSRKHFNLDYQIIKLTLYNGKGNLFRTLFSRVEHKAFNLNQKLDKRMQHHLNQKSGFCSSDYLVFARGELMLPAYSQIPPMPHTSLLRPEKNTSNTYLCHADSFQIILACFFSCNTFPTQGIKQHRHYHSHFTNKATKTPQKCK